MKVFITASSGVGKSSVIKELIERGYSAYDADDRRLGLTRLEVKDTGEPVDWPKGFVDWHYYSCNASESRVKELLAGNETVLIAGFLGNQDKLYPLFDTLIALDIGPTEHERRLRSRPKRDVGDDDRNIERRLEKYSAHMSNFVSSGFIVIDNSGPVADTVDQILRIIDA